MSTSIEGLREQLARITERLNANNVTGLPYFLRCLLHSHEQHLEVNRNLSKRLAVLEAEADLPEDTESFDTRPTMGEIEKRDWPIGANVLTDVQHYADR